MLLPTVLLIAKFIEFDSPRGSGRIESLNAKLTEESLNRERFTTLTNAKILIGSGARIIIRYVRIIAP